MKIGSMSAGSRPKSKPFRVISESVKSFDPPPEFVEIYWIEVVATGKRFDKLFHTLEEAEFKCEEMNSAACAPD